MENQDKSIENRTDAEIEKANKAKSDRVKRMRGWLGVKGTSTTHGCFVEGEAPSYGDAPNGWNR